MCLRLFSPCFGSNNLINAPESYDPMPNPTPRPICTFLACRFATVKAGDATYLTKSQSTWRKKKIQQNKRISTLCSSSSTFSLIHQSEQTDHDFYFYTFCWKCFGAFLSCLFVGCKAGRISVATVPVERKGCLSLSIPSTLLLCCKGNLTEWHLKWQLKSASGQI